MDVLSVVLVLCRMFFCCIAVAGFYTILHFGTLFLLAYYCPEGFKQ